MADDPTLDNGALTDYIVSADQVPGTLQYIQRMKLCYSADGVDTHIGADVNGLDVDVVRLPALAAGTNNIGDVDVLTMPTTTVKHAGTTGATTSVSATVTANTTLIAADANRFGLTIYNESASATLFVLMGAGTQSATVYTTQVPPNWLWEVPDAMVVLRASGNWSAAVGAARITAVT